MPVHHARHLEKANKNLDSSFLTNFDLVSPVSKGPGQMDNSMSHERYIKKDGQSTLSTHSIND